MRCFGVPKAEYRSSIRSKNLIKKALAKLIHEKDISKITVSDIIREADISRGTFYAHYADVNGVIEQIECEELQNLINFVDDFGFENISNDTKTFIKLICEYLSRDMEYYRMLVQSNIINNFIWRLVNIYYEKLLSVLIESGKCSKNDADLYLLYIASGAKAVVVGWLNGEIKGSPDEVSDRLGKIIDSCKAFFD